MTRGGAREEGRECVWQGKTAGGISLLPQLGALLCVCTHVYVSALCLSDKRALCVVHALLSFLLVSLQSCVFSFIITCCRGYICTHVHTRYSNGNRNSPANQADAQLATGEKLSESFHVSLRINPQHCPVLIWWGEYAQFALIRVQRSSQGRDPALSTSSCCTNGDFQD